MKYTKGPWKVATHLDTDEVVVRSEDDLIVCNCQIDQAEYKQMSEILANAQLISAAPELLEACEELLLWLKNNDEGETGVAIRAQAAISKAEGK